MAVEDLLNEDLIVESPGIVVQQVFEFVRGTEVPRQGQPRATTFGDTKSLLGFYDLVRQTLEDYESRAGTPQENRVKFTEDEPDIKSQSESIVFSLVERKPGQFAQGSPMSRSHSNYRPRMREDYADPDNPGYRCVVNGYYYDNIVRFTAWAKTNKAANARAMWFEDMMEEYSWWYKLQGVDRVLFWGRSSDQVIVVNDNKWYGRPMDYFVRTEKIRTFKQKTLEEILIKLSTAQE